MSVPSKNSARTAMAAIAAVGALALVAVPSAAHAADVVTCTQQATAETQPWLTFSETENFYADYGLALDIYFDTALDLTNAVPESFTSSDLDAYEEGIVEANADLETSIGGLATNNGLATLIQQLSTVDPGDTTGWDATLSGLFADLAAVTDNTEYEAALDSFSAAQLTFSTDAAALVEADVPVGGPFDRPAIPESLVTDADTIADALDDLAAGYQTIFLDAAAAFVVYEDVCVTTTVPDAVPAAVAPAAPAKTLAATGTSDGIALGASAALLLLVGAAAMITVRRRTAA